VSVALTNEPRFLRTSRPGWRPRASSHRRPVVACSRWAAGAESSSSSSPTSSGEGNGRDRNSRSGTKKAAPRLAPYPVVVIHPCFPCAVNGDWRGRTLCRGPAPAI
jgi:hypothetical protein